MLVTADTDAAEVEGTGDAADVGADFTEAEITEDELDPSMLAECGYINLKLY